MTSDQNDVVAGLEGELEPLWRFALRLTGRADQASDLVQRTCVRALENRDKYERRGKLRSWLFSIQHRIWLNELRSSHLRQFESLDTVSDRVLSSRDDSSRPSGSVSADNAESRTLLEQVLVLVESLPEAQRLVLILVAVEGFSYRETADILDIRIGTVMSRLARARLVLGKHMLNDASTKSASGWGGQSMETRR